MTFVSGCSCRQYSFSSSIRFIIRSSIRGTNWSLCPISSSSRIVICGSTDQDQHMDAVLPILFSFQEIQPYSEIQSYPEIRSHPAPKSLCEEPKITFQTRELTFCAETVYIRPGSAILEHVAGKHFRIRRGDMAAGAGAVHTAERERHEG